MAGELVGAGVTLLEDCTWWGSEVQTHLKGGGRKIEPKCGGEVWCSNALWRELGGGDANSEKEGESKCVE